MNKAFFIPALLWMILIFFFSAMPEDVSTEQSDYVSVRLQKIILATLSGDSEVAMDEWEEWTEDAPHFSVRKAAHVFEYTMLCVLMFVGFAGGRYARRLSFFGTVLYSVTDEIHQLFVPGRSGTFVDVAIDSTGALLGFVFIMLAGPWMMEMKKRILKEFAVRKR
ncbi:MAG: VanZ family protein [Clostridia bacterium]|nr:VanZ family protein [Clostridia bacterium]